MPSQYVVFSADYAAIVQLADSKSDLPVLGYLESRLEGYRVAHDALARER